MTEHTHGHSHAVEEFPTSTEGLPEAVSTQVVDLADGDAVELRIGPVAKYTLSLHDALPIYRKSVV